MALMAVAAACTPEPQPAPTITATVEISLPSLTSCGSDEAGDDADAISSALGYAFSPTFAPEGFQHSGSSVDRRRRANLVYRRGQEIILIAYPVTFEPLGSPTMVELGLKNAANAISDVKVGDIAGHIMRGGWSEETILAGPGIDPANTRWDYERSLTVYFSCRGADSESIGVAVQYIPGVSGVLVSQSELTDMAKSMLSLEGLP